ncbi:MAG: septum formation initiator family protein [Verrucomicrobia bacterium]|nr:septum formation initiator family protein [Verrucomicrobiota bacterium]
MNLRRVIITFYLLLFLSLAAGASIFFLQTRREYRQLLKSEAESKRLLAEAQLKLREQQRILDRLRSDPAFVEMVIRRRLGYAKPDEMIFRFESMGEPDLRREERPQARKRVP